MMFHKLPNLALQDQIDFLEGHRFEGMHFKPFQFATLQNFQCLHIQGIRIADKLDQQPLNFLPNLPLLISLYKLGLPLRYWVKFRQNQLSLNLLVTPNECGVLRNLLLKNVDPDALEIVSEAFTPLQYALCFSGIPRIYTMENAQSILQYLATSLRDVNWDFLVLSNPEPYPEIVSLLTMLRERIEAVEIQFLHGDIQEKDRAARHYVKLLEYYLARFQKGLHSGIWRTGIYFLADQAPATEIAAGLICSLLYNENTHSIPIRAHRFLGRSQTNSLCSELNADELLSCFQLPTIELTGFSMRETPAFDIDVPGSISGSPALEIGTILDHQRQESHAASVKLENLNKHTLVAGVTGSGKTNTIFQILYQGWKKYHIPFLVIEPVKSEYRALFNLIPELQVFTLGYENPQDSLPIRLNPFYFPAGVPLQNHIDSLKNVFFSSFALYPPMPYVLEECLYRVYLDNGWNLITSTNQRGICAEAYPTIDDLYARIADVVRRLGYEARLAMDIRAALQTRINNLRLGAKGLMLNTREVVDFTQLFQKPTLLELKFMGNEDEKSFLMALILTFLYEFRESERTPHQEGALHLLVIEEAHRLLRNIDKQRRSDEANIKAAAIESFTNILAEIRAYHQGVIIADQIPSQLASEVIKNTNLKIVHRTVAFDEQETLGLSMACNEKQRRYMAQLNTGEAVLYQEGMDAANLVKVHLLEMTSGKIPTNNRLRTARKDLIHHPDRSENILNGSAIQQSLMEFATSQKAAILTAKLVMTLILSKSPEPVIAAYLEIKHRWREISLTWPSPKSTLSKALRHIIEKSIEQRARFYGIPFKDMIKLKNIIGRIATHIEKDQLPSGLHPLTLSFKKSYLDLRDHQNGPYAGCIHCNSHCLFRFEGKLLADNSQTDETISEMLNPKSGASWQNILQLLYNTIEEIYENRKQPKTKDLLVCSLVHKLKQLNISNKNTHYFINEILRRR